MKLEARDFPKLQLSLLAAIMMIALGAGSVYVMLNKIKATGRIEESFCLACYDGKYPVPYDPLIDKHIIERRKRQAQTLGEAVAKDSEQIKLPV